MIELLIEAESALSLGMLDRAEILYRQVAGADPRNSIAVVGLARVMLERGDEPGALKLARRALAIDAENTAAQRMTQRLEEVLRFRGAEVAPEVPAPMPIAPEAATPVAHARPRPAAPTSTPGAPTESTQSEHAAPAPGPPEAPPHQQPPASRSLVDRLLRRS